MFNNASFLIIFAFVPFSAIIMIFFCYLIVFSLQYGVRHEL